MAAINAANRIGIGAESENDDRVLKSDRPKEKQNKALTRPPPIPPNSNAISVRPPIILYSRSPTAKPNVNRNNILDVNLERGILRILYLKLIQKIETIREVERE